MQTTLFYFHDPMCSWCWGFQPTWSKLQQLLPVSVGVQYVVGGLAPDSDQPMPEEMQAFLQQTWQRISDRLGTEFNFDFWTECKPRRSTYPACRAVIAAGFQEKEKEMISAIQHGYYLQARNPSDLSTLEAFADEIGLNVQQFRDDMASEDLEQLFQKHLALQEVMPVSGFPSLVLYVNNRYLQLRLDYENAHTMINQIEQAIKQDG